MSTGLNFWQPDIQKPHFISFNHAGMGRVLSFLFILFATNILQIYLKDKKFLVITF